MTLAQPRGFFRLSERMRSGIVNRLGWRELRPVQELAIEAVADGCNALVLAPTAGGKTEAAMLPVLDLLSRNPRQGVGALYLSPLRALLNNQEDRIEKLAGLVGLEAFKWHGEVGAGDRKQFKDQPAQVLLITPESLEVVLSTRSAPVEQLLKDLQIVIIDEIHAFAGDDRGDHLVALLERLSTLLNRDFQRLGLSATVGNPELLLEWLSGSSKRPRRIVDPGRSPSKRVVEIRPLKEEDDPGFLGGLMAKGRKSLFFADSRAKAEKLRRALEEAGVRAFSHHSSLSQELREDSERAFRSGSNCCIVCTSTLELGLDVGDLDLVLQMDAPDTVSAFLQRFGRVGRRQGSRGHMVFLTDRRWSFLRACALVGLAVEGWVEPVEPSQKSVHILVHQLLARVLETGGTSRSRLLAGLGNPFCFGKIERPEEILEHLISLDILTERDGRVLFGIEGEKAVGHSNFRELYSVFDSARQLQVRTTGNRPIGTVEAWFAQSLGERGNLFALGGRTWKVVHCDWGQGVLTVERSFGGQAPSWSGAPRLLSRAVCEKIRRLLGGTHDVPFLGEAAAEVLQELRGEWGELVEDGPAVRHDDKGVDLVTFAGGRINNALGRALEQKTGGRVSVNNYQVRVGAEAADVLEALRAFDPGSLAPKGKLSKFQRFLPPEWEQRFLAERIFELDGAAELARKLTEVSWRKAQPKDNPSKRPGRPSSPA